MEWAVLGLFIMFVIVTYIVVQGTRAALAWRKAAAEGDAVPRPPAPLPWETRHTSS